MLGKGRMWSVAAAAVALALASAGTASAKFGENGKVVEHFDGVNTAFAVSTAPGGKLVVGGAVLNPSSDFATLRFRNNGALDTGYGAMGIRIDDFIGFEEGHDVLVLKNGKVVMVGMGGFPIPKATILRYTAAGEPDIGFGFSGSTLVSLPDASVFTAVARQKDGKLVAVGGHGADILVARFAANGVIDESFGTNGYTSVAIDELNAAYSVAIDRKGKIVIGGDARPDFVQPARMAFVRLRPNGKLDKSFSKDGKQTISLPGGSLVTDVLTRGKKIYAAGFKIGTPSHPVLVRLNGKGRRDKKFAGKGVKVHRYGARAELNALAFQGKRLVGAGRRDDPVSDFFVARFKLNGAKDKSFGKKGWRSTDINGGDVANDLAVQKNKKIVLAGTSGGQDGFVLVRYKPGGGLDK